MEQLKHYKREITAGLLVVLALLSFFIIADSGWVQGLNQNLVESLDSKKNTVAALAATSVATSTSITLLPNDIGSPIAENLVDLTKYLVVIFGAIWLQKYLVGLAGVLFFKICLPISSLLFAGNLFWKKEGLKQFAGKLLVFGALVFILIPTSVSISNHIEKTHENAVEQTVKQAQKDNSVIQKEAEDEGGFFDGISNFITNAYDDTVEKVQVTLSNLLDSIAVLIVTTCVIPILVFVFFAWVVKLIFGIDMSFRALPIKKIASKKRIVKEIERE